MFDTYDAVLTSMEESKPELIKLLEAHIDLESLIPEGFYRAFYKSTGREHSYHLVSFLWFFILKKLFSIGLVSQMILILNCSKELRDLCGFDKVPGQSRFSEFCKNYCAWIEKFFEHLVEVTEPICREIDAKKADYLIYDTTGIEPPVAENNPKFFNSKLKQAKQSAKVNPELNPYKLVYGLLPDQSETNPDARQQYINGHYAYAMKAGIVTNGLGVVRAISFFDNDFRSKHPEVVTPKSDDPDKDKEIGDSVSLKPVVNDFFDAHPDFHYGTFIGDSAFDSYDNYSFLRKMEFHRVCVPLNPRNSASSNETANGVPCCPADGTPFIRLGRSGGRNRSERIKWVCPKSERIPGTAQRVCTCEHPCTSAKTGKFAYTYPDDARDFRACPGIQRNTEHWDNLYRHRVMIERTIFLLKDSFALDETKSFRTVTLKADLFFAGIAQLLGVILAEKLHRPEFFKSVKKLLAA